jgi:predicted DNA-binding transcriptional regulator AlpA
MPLDILTSDEELLPAAKVRSRYNVSDQTLWRWETDEKLDFPQAIRINSRRYWRRIDLQAFELRLTANVKVA